MQLLQANQTKNSICPPTSLPRARGTEVNDAQMREENEPNTSPSAGLRMMDVSLQPTDKLQNLNEAARRDAYMKSEIEIRRELLTEQRSLVAN